MGVEFRNVEGSSIVVISIEGRVQHVGTETIAERNGTRIGATVNRTRDPAEAKLNDAALGSLFLGENRTRNKQEREQCTKRKQLDDIHCSRLSLSVRRTYPTGRWSRGFWSGSSHSHGSKFCCCTPRGCRCWKARCPGGTGRRAKTCCGTPDRASACVPSITAGWRSHASRDNWCSFLSRVDAPTGK